MEAAISERQEQATGGSSSTSQQQSTTATTHTVGVPKLAKAKAAEARNSSGSSSSGVWSMNSGDPGGRIVTTRPARYLTLQGLGLCRCCLQSVEHVLQILDGLVLILQLPDAQVKITLGLAEGLFELGVLG